MCATGFHWLETWELAVLNVFLHHQTKQLKQIKQSRGVRWVSQCYNENMGGISCFTFCGVNALSVIKYINNSYYKYARLLKDKNAAVPPSRGMVWWKSNQELKDGREGCISQWNWLLCWDGKGAAGIQSRACPGAAVQLCLAILCTINLNKERASGKTLGLLIKCFAP